MLWLRWALGLLPGHWSGHDLSGYRKLRGAGCAHAEAVRQVEVDRTARLRLVTCYQEVMRLSPSECRTMERRMS